MNNKMSNFKRSLKDIIEFSTLLPEIKIKQLPTLDGKYQSYLFIENFRFKTDSITNVDKSYKMGRLTHNWVVELFVHINDKAFFIGTCDKVEEESANAIVDGFVNDIKTQILFDTYESS